MNSNLCWKAVFSHPDLEVPCVFEAKDFNDCAIFVASSLLYYPDGNYKFEPFLKED